jgi:hypothetical protein
LSLGPSNHASRGVGLHELRQHVGIEDDHSSKAGMSRAARTLKRAFVFSSNCRMVSVAMPAMIALLATNTMEKEP